MFMPVVMRYFFNIIYLFPVIAVIIVVISMGASQLQGYGTEQA
jgi:general stress protein CsbA